MKKLVFLIGFSLFIQMEVSAQSITNVSPNRSYRDTTLDVTILGQSTRFGQGTSVLNQSVWFSQATNVSGDIIYPNFVTASSTTLMIANFTIPANVNVGYYNVNHFNSIDGLIMLANGYRLDYNIVGSVSEFDKKYSLNLYPNPSSDFLTVEMEISDKSTVSIQLYDSQGRIIYQKEYLEEGVGKIKYNLDLSSLAISPGSHIVKIRIDDEFTAKTLIVK